MTLSILKHLIFISKSKKKTYKAILAFIYYAILDLINDWIKKFNPNSAQS